MARPGKVLVVRIVAAAAVVLLAVGIRLLWSSDDDETPDVDAPEVGACLVLSGTVKASRHEEVDCADGAAAYKVTADDGKCDQAEANHEISTGGDNGGDIADLCIDLNAVVGDCFTESSAGAFATKVACNKAKDDPKAQKVVSIGNADDQCVTGAQPRKNATRDTLLCLGPTT